MPLATRSRRTKPAYPLSASPQVSTATACRFGVQFYGNLTGEDLLLRLAVQLEQARPEWFGARPGYTWPPDRSRQVPNAHITGDPTGLGVVGQAHTPDGRQSRDFGRRPGLVRGTTSIRRAGIVRLSCLGRKGYKAGFALILPQPLFAIGSPPRLGRSGASTGRRDGVEG
jgi:hypothetical protein